MIDLDWLIGGAVWSPESGSPNVEFALVLTGEEVPPDADTPSRVWNDDRDTPAANELPTTQASNAADRAHVTRSLLR